MRTRRPFSNHPIGRAMRSMTTTRSDARARSDPTEITMLYIGEGFEGSGGNAAHINLLLGPKTGPIATAYATAAASPGPGHIPFQAVLKPNLPAKPSTLFIGKANSAGDAHDLLTWGPAQAGVAAGITKALLDGVLPPEAED